MPAQCSNGQKLAKELECCMGSQTLGVVPPLVLGAARGSRWTTDRGWAPTRRLGWRRSGPKVGTDRRPGGDLGGTGSYCE